MADTDKLLKKIEDEIKEAAKAVEDFADKVAAPQAPVVILPEEDKPSSKPADKD